MVGLSRALSRPTLRDEGKLMFAVQSVKALQDYD